jgi:hypothetical protein
MISFFKRLFGIGEKKPSGNVVYNADGGVTIYPEGIAPPASDDLAALASNPAKQEEFITALARQGVWIITKPNRTSDSEVSFLDYDDNGVPVFPVFSSMDCAGRFIQAMPHDGITTYGCISVAASFLVDNDFSKTKLLLNPKTNRERQITDDDLAALRTISVA